MKRKEIDSILYNIREFLNKNNKFKELNTHIIFIKDNDKNDGTALIWDKNFDIGIKINLKDFSYSHMYNEDFDFDSDIFKELENGKNVVFVSDEENYNIWTNLECMGVDEIKCQDGWQKYLKYCKENGITKEYLDKKFNSNVVDMKLYYMENYNDMKKEIEKMLKNNKEYCEYKVQCILIDNNDMKKSYAIAMNYNDVIIIDISKKEIDEINNAEYTFDIGSDSIFPSLETETMEIAYMSIEAHSYIWEEINRYYPDDIDNKKGMQMYLKYCKENGVTKESIVRLTNCNEISDVMKYFQEKNKKIKNREER